MKVLALIPLILVVLWAARRLVEIPRKPAALTRYLKRNYVHLEKAKVSGSDREWVIDLGWQIIGVGLNVHDLTALEKFAAIFAVNQVFKLDEAPCAEKVQNFLQGVLVADHARECSIRYLHSTDQFPDCWEIKLGHWSTHIPKRNVQLGSLEAAGRPNVRTILEGYRVQPRARPHRINY